MRVGELLGLTWEDVDFAASVIRVRRQADRKGQLVEPKTPQAKREIVLAPALAKVLREHRMASRFKADGDLVFPSSTGRALGARNLTRRGLDKALERAGLGKLRFHDLRHTFASLLVAEGLNVVFVSRQMGHSSPDITLSRLLASVGSGRACRQGERCSGRRLGRRGRVEFPSSVTSALGMRCRVPSLERESRVFAGLSL